MSVNKYNLSRHIPEKIKTAVRKRDGFGCVLCGLGIYTYEHYNPEFKDAKFHDLNGICLLCGQCQDKTSKGLLSKETIAEGVKNPKCKQQGYTNEFFDLKFPIIIRFGNVQIHTDGNQDHSILTFCGEAIVKVKKQTPENLFQFSASFKDKHNNTSLQINKNEWITSTNNWDIKQIGNQLSIINDPLDTKIVILINPPHELIFQELDMYNKGDKIHFDAKGDDGKLIIIRNTGEILTITIEGIRKAYSLNF